MRLANTWRCKFLASSNLPAAFLASSAVLNSWHLITHSAARKKTKRPSGNCWATGSMYDASGAMLGKNSDGAVVPVGTEVVIRQKLRCSADLVHRLFCGTTISSLH